MDAGRALPQAEAPADHDDAVREYHEFLLMVPHWGQLVISWEQVERYVSYDRGMIRDQ